jgi:hypothetical protein
LNRILHAVSQFKTLLVSSGEGGTSWVFFRKFCAVFLTQSDLCSEQSWFSTLCVGMTLALSEVPIAPAGGA